MLMMVKLIRRGMKRPSSPLPSAQMGSFWWPAAKTAFAGGHITLHFRWSHYITFQVVTLHYISGGHITLHFSWSHHIACMSFYKCLTIAGSGRRMTDGGAAKSGSTPGAFSFSQAQVWPAATGIQNLSLSLILWFCGWKILFRFSGGWWIKVLTLGLSWEAPGSPLPFGRSLPFLTLKLIYVGQLAILNMSKR